MKSILHILALLFVTTTGLVNGQSNYVAGKLQGSQQDNDQVNAAPCDTIFSFPGIDPWLSGIAFDGTYIWNGGYNNTYIYKHNLTGVVVDSVAHPLFNFSAPKSGDLDFDGTNILFFQEETDTLYTLDLNGNVISSFRIAPCTGNCYGVAFDGTNVWISDYLPQALYKVNPATGVVINSFSISTGVFMLPIKFINGKLYGLGISPPTLFEMDTTSGAVLSSAPWCLGYPLGFCVADNHVWGASSQISIGGTQRIYKFDDLILGSQDNIFIEENAIKVFPNPSNGNVQLNFSKLIQNGELEIFDVIGQSVYFKNIESSLEMKVELNGLQNGIYFLKMFDGEKYSAAKLVLDK